MGHDSSICVNIISRAMYSKRINVIGLNLCLNLKNTVYLPYMLVKTRLKWAYVYKQKTIKNVVSSGISDSHLKSFYQISLCKYHFCYLLLIWTNKKTKLSCYCALRGEIWNHSLAIQIKALGPVCQFCAFYRLLAQPTSSTWEHTLPRRSSCLHVLCTCVF